MEVHTTKIHTPQHGYRKGVLDYIYLTRTDRTDDTRS